MQKRSRPYVPILSSTPARMTEPDVGASVCASGEPRVERHQRHLDRERERERREQPESACRPAASPAMFVSCTTSVVPSGRSAR